MKLSWNEATRQATVEAAVLIEHAKTLGNALNEADEQKLIAETLADISRTASAEGGTHLRRPAKPYGPDPAVRVAAGRTDQDSEASRIEARQQFPFPLEQLEWDYQFLTEAGADGTLRAVGPTKSLAARAAARFAGRFHAAVSRRLSTAEHPGRYAAGRFRRLAQSSRPRVSLARGRSPGSRNAPAAVAPTAVATLDVGCDVTNLVISSPHSLWFRSCGIAGHSFTRTLVKEFKLSVAQAEQRKRSPESAERLFELYEAMSPVFEDLLKELRQCLAAYAVAQPDRPVQHLLGVGGGFSLHGLLRWLWHGR